MTAIFLIWVMAVNFNGVLAWGTDKADVFENIRKSYEIDFQWSMSESLAGYSGVSVKCKAIKIRFCKKQFIFHESKLIGMQTIIFSDHRDVVATMENHMRHNEIDNGFDGLQKKKQYSVVKKDTKILYEIASETKPDRSSGCIGEWSNLAYQKLPTTYRRCSSLYQLMLNESNELRP